MKYIKTSPISLFTQNQQFPITKPNTLHTRNANVDSIRLSAKSTRNHERNHNDNTMDVYTRRLRNAHLKL